jgi:thioesterase domain-containing protein/acyl carrier protein
MLPDRAALRRHLLEDLPDYMVPDSFTWLPSLPIDANGKVDRRSLPAPGPETADDAELVEPRSAVERRMAEIWSDVLGVSPIGVTANFFELGGHSLLAVRLAARIEEAFGRRLPIAALFENGTIEHLAALIDSRAVRASHPALVPIQPRGAKTPFFCVHEFFGDVLVYDQLARKLGQDQPFYGLQARGVEGEGAPLREVGEMAAHYIHAVRTVQPAGPYALGGLCAGGLVAFEMAQQLAAEGEQVALLALLDTSARPLAFGRERTAEGDGVMALLRAVPEWLGGLSQLTPDQWRDLVRLKSRLSKVKLQAALRSSASREAEDQSAARIRELTRHFELSAHHRRVAEAWRDALKAYRPKPYTGRVVLFRARVQPLFGSHDSTKGWRDIAPVLEVRVVPGNHLGMLREPHVNVLAAELASRLAEIAEELSGR